MDITKIADYIDLYTEAESHKGLMCLTYRHILGHSLKCVSCPMRIDDTCYMYKRLVYFI